MASKKKKSDPTSPTVTLDYIKSSAFHSIQADGAIGGITPNGHIHMAFFNERSAIPRRVVHELNEDGTLGPLRQMETRNSIVREMNIDVFMTQDAATELHAWLGNILKDLKNEKQDRKPGKKKSGRSAKK